MFSYRSFATDDSIMTIALAQAILACEGDYSRLGELAAWKMQLWGMRYPDAGYGGRFRNWLMAENPHSYNSFGNGAAMRVSPCGYAANSMEEALMLSDAVTGVTHNHPEGMKGARAVTAAIFMALHGSTIPEIKKHIEDNYYKINFTLDEIRDTYSFDVSCQGTVPQALEAFFESVSFEDAIRNAISIGGDSDTLAAITGSVAAAYYDVPESIRKAALTFLDNEQTAVIRNFEEKYMR